MKENGYGLHDKKLSNILTNKWILWNVFIRLLKIPLRPYNEKKFVVYYFRGKRRTSSKCLIYFHCPTVTKKPANLWDEKTIAFIILSLDEAKHIFVEKKMKIEGSDRKYLPSEYCRLIVLGSRVDQWVRSLDLATHTSLSPIRRGFAPRFVNYKLEAPRSL